MKSEMKRLSIIIDVVWSIVAVMVFYTNIYSPMAGIMLLFPLVRNRVRRWIENDRNGKEFVREIILLTLSIFAFLYNFGCLIALYSANAIVIMLSAAVNILCSFQVLFEYERIQYIDTKKGKEYNEENEGGESE